MTPAALNQEIYTAFVAAMVLAGPPLLIATVAGLFIGVLQAATQIQDQTLTQTVKIFTIGAVLLIGGLALSSRLYQYALHVFSAFPVMVR